MSTPPANLSLVIRIGRLLVVIIVMTILSISGAKVFLVTIMFFNLDLNSALQQPFFSVQTFAEILPSQERPEFRLQAELFEQTVVTDGLQETFVNDIAD
jgi:hypothetical protein